MVCSGSSLQHSQSASPADIRVYNENLGLSVNHAAKVPDHLSSDHARHPHVSRAPEPPPVLHEGAVLGHGRALAVENGSATSEERVAEQRAAGSSHRGGVPVRDADYDHRLPPSPNVSTQFTSDISLASSSITAYEDNGRQKVSLSAHLFHIVTSTTFVGGTVFTVVCFSVYLFVCIQPVKCLVHVSQRFAFVETGPNMVLTTHN